ncbi:MAG: Gfo/Idh/MocA family oxidoreductase [Candidatus Latescibacteria bacterium]|nr:Gfo/Idh/MocA family oxidoreductase [Candidatus Latescibacterota bacterium]MBT5829885.1 Gfo/Idh/MocA family oxidoreductase [Candidatus Latescibacterota bacterium]
MAIKTCLMIGGGGMAGGWIQRIQNNFGDRIKIVGLVDVNQDVLETQAQALGLSKNQLFTSHEDALSSVKADFCGVATPPQFHAPAVIAALEAGMPVICEKPISGTLEESKAMVAATNKTGLPCAIIQNYRYARNKQELVRIRTEGRLGRLQHIVGRYACDYRKMGSWGKEWRHTMEFGLLFEGSVHHFDMLRFLSGGDPETLMGFGWNPEWSSFTHHSSGLYLMNMDNGTHTCYEGNSSAAGITNCWHREHYRAEFEEGCVEVSEGNTMTIHRVGQDSEIYEAPEIQWEGHDHLFDEFLNWLDGGAPSETRIEKNIVSFAMVIAAKETTLDGQPKKIADYLK